jgi:tetratricopeptide (TPR) repeat protein
LGKDGKHAQEMLLLIVKVEKLETRLAEGWYTLADQYRAQGNKDQARLGFVKCLEYSPETAFHDRSRYWLAVDEIDKKNFPQAKVMLEQILLSENRAPDWPSQEKAQYKLGWLYLQIGDFAKARPTLDEAISRYPQNPNVILAREQLGECHRRLADSAFAKAEENTKAALEARNSARRESLFAYVRQQEDLRKEHLRDAIKSYQILVDELELRGQERKLNSVEHILLRRGWYGIAECCFDRREFSEGMANFQKVQRTYPSSLEGFYSCLRICNLAEECIKKKHADAARFGDIAREALRGLQEELRKMPADHELFRSPGVSSREQWQQWAEKSQNNLGLAPRPDRPGPLAPPGLK